MRLSIIQTTTIGMHNDDAKSLEGLKACIISETMREQANIERFFRLETIMNERALKGMPDQRIRESFGGRGYRGMQKIRQLGSNQV